MSVINNMLRDLDARRVDAGDDEVLPGEVLAAPRSRRPISRGVLAVLLLAVVLAVALLYFWPRPAQRLPQPTMIVDAGVVSEAVAPPTAQPPAAARAVLSSEASAPVVSAAMPAPAAALLSAPARETSPVAPLSMPVARLSVPRAEQVGRAAVPEVGKAPIPAVPVRASVPANADMPVAQAMPVAALPVVALPGAVVSPVGSAASIRLEQSTQTSQERNIAEVQHAADLQRRGALVEAETGLRGVLDNDKGMLAARLALVSLLSRQQRTDEARKVLKEGVDHSPTQAQLLLPYARLLAGQGEWGAAHAALTPATDALAQNAEYRALSGAVLQRLGQFSQSAVEYRAALRLVPSAGAWWVGLGLSLEGDGRPVEARNAYLQARGNALGPDLAQFVENKLARLGPAD